MEQKISPLARLWSLVRLDKKDITTVYFYAILNGLIQLSLPLGIQAIIGFVLGGAVSASLVLLISLVVLGVLFNGLLQINQMKVIERIQQHLFVRYAYAFADRIPRLDMQKVDGYYLPELVNRFFETPTLQKSFAKLLLDLPTAMIQILFGLLLLSFYHQAFILFGLVLVALLWIILRITSSKGMETSLEESKYKYAVAAWFEEMARVIKTFKFSQTTGLHLRKADNKAIKYLDARKQHFGILLMQYRTLVGFKVLITAAMLIVGSMLLLNQQINIGQFIASEIIILTIITSVEKIIINLDSVYDVMTSVEKISKVVEKPLEENGTMPMVAGQPIGIEARSVTFGYNGHPILQHLSFRIAPGQKVCITGENGAGKSTLLRLLSGAYAQFDGSVLVNGVPIFNYDLASYRAHTSIMLHHEDIFQATLRENLTMGRDNIDTAYLNDLVARVGLTSFLASLDKGYDTELDPAGKRLPRNVVQKIQLVRALLFKPGLLLLEEPWQGMEAPYRQNIQDLLLHDLKGTTVLVSSTDMQFAQRCDSVIDLSENAQKTR
jgi:ABC-type bacteriocin/lantibiotic exporter with double-glycine peptidase domain